MLIKQLILKHFRNYENLTLVLKPGVNVLYGKNGQGKTNILESIYLCTCASSHRTSKDKELIFKEAHEYDVFLQFESNKRDQSIQIRYLEAIAQDLLRQKNQRIVNHNGIKLDKINQLPGLFNAVIFAPEDMKLVKDGPQARRRFLDLLISQIKPTYFSDLQKFNVVLQQRNKLLKQMKENGIQQGYENPFSIQLDIWDEQYADVSLRLIETRKKMIDQLNGFARESHYQISNGLEVLNLRYKTIFDHSENSEDKDHDLKIVWKKMIIQKLERHRQEDIKRGSTSIGPHRDDLIIEFNNLPIKLYGSQGQQRTAVLSLKIAELKLIESTVHQKPVLLLDDCMSELDQQRRSALVEYMKDCQVLITCTEKEWVHHALEELAGLTHVSTYHVQNGQITSGSSMI